MLKRPRAHGSFSVTTWWKLARLHGQAFLIPIQESLNTSLFFSGFWMDFIKTIEQSGLRLFGEATTTTTNEFPFLLAILDAILKP